MIHSPDQWCTLNCSHKPKVRYEAKISTQNQLSTCLVFEQPPSQLVRVCQLGSKGHLLHAVRAQLDELGAGHVGPVEGNLNREK